MLSALAQQHPDASAASLVEAGRVQVLAVARLVGSLDELATCHLHRQRGTREGRCRWADGDAHSSQAAGAALPARARGKQRAELCWWWAGRGGARQVQRGRRRACTKNSGVGGVGLGGGGAGRLGGEGGGLGPFFSFM